MKSFTQISKTRRIVHNDVCGIRSRVAVEHAGVFGTLAGLIIDLGKALPLTYHQICNDPGNHQRALHSELSLQHKALLQQHKKIIIYKIASSGTENMRSRQMTSMLHIYSTASLDLPGDGATIIPVCTFLQIPF